MIQVENLNALGRENDDHQSICNNIEIIDGNNSQYDSGNSHGNNNIANDDAVHGNDNNDSNSDINAEQVEFAAQAQDPPSGLTINDPMQIKEGKNINEK